MKNTSISSKLIMLSGGIDSTFTLINGLIKDDSEIIVHHINFINKENRHKIEAIRTRSIVKWLHQNIRKFKYSETTVDRRNMRFFGTDIISVGFEAGIAAHSYFWETKKHIDYWTIGTCKEEGHNEKRFQHALAACRANCYPHEPPEFYLSDPLPKLEQMKRMPPELLKLCWTCRRPVYINNQEDPKPCGKCATCNLLNKIYNENYKT